jgi:hypothetical protein
MEAAQTKRDMAVVSSQARAGVMIRLLLYGPEAGLEV